MASTTYFRAAAGLSMARATFNMGKQRPHMHIRTLFISVLLCHHAMAQTPPSVQWSKVYGGSSEDGANAIRATSDGGYIVIGTTRSSDGDIDTAKGGEDLWVLKLDGNGTVEWQRTYGGSGHDRGFDILPMPDGNYVAAGSTASINGDVSSNHGSTDAWLLGLDASGNLLWEKTLGGSGSDVANAILINEDHSIVMIGGTRSSDGDVAGNHGGEDFWILKFVPPDSIVWQAVLGGAASEAANAGAHVGLDGYIIIGNSLSTNGDLTGPHGGGDQWVVRLDADGSMLWQRTLGGPGSDQGYGILHLPDGGFATVGSTLSTSGDAWGNHGGSDVWVTRNSSNGGLLWQVCLGGSLSDNGVALLPMDDGGFLAAAHTTSSNGNIGFNHGLTDGWLVRLNASGIPIWEQSYGGSNQDWFGCMATTDDGGFILAGSTMSSDGDVPWGLGNKDLWVLKLGPEGVGIPEHGGIDVLGCYPNPAHDMLEVRISPADGACARLQLCNVFGQVVSQAPDAVCGPGAQSIRMPIAHLPAGSYVLRAISGTSVVNARFVKQ